MSPKTRRAFIKTGALLAAASAAPRIAFPQASSKTPKLNVFSKHLQFLDYPEMAVRAKEIGFEGIDLTVRPGGHVEPSSVASDLPDAYDVIRSEGLEIPMMTTAVDDASDPIDRSVLSEAAKLGIGHYRMNWFRYPDGLTLPDALLHFQQEVTNLSDLNQELNIIGCYQNHAGTLVGASLWEVWELLRKANSKHMGVQYDIRHATVEGGRSWTNGFKLVAPKIRTIVVKDFKWVKTESGTQLVNTPLGEGMVDFSRYFKMLKAENIQVPISIHFEYDLGGAQQGKRTLTKGADFVFDSMRRDVETFKKLWSAA